MQSVNLGKIKVFGTKKEIDAAVPSLINLQLKDESSDRLAIQKLIETRKFTASILYSGNTGWYKEKLLRNFRLIKKSNDMSKMNDYTYKFLSLSCGSIAHFNKYGWISTYPTVSDLKKFFKYNEYGQSVLNHQPRWKTDAIEIIKEINKVLGV